MSYTLCRDEQRFFVLPGLSLSFVLDDYAATVFHTLSFFQATLLRQLWMASSSIAIVYPRRCCSRVDDCVHGIKQHIEDPFALFHK